MMKDSDVCQVRFSDQEKVDSLLRCRKDARTMAALAEIFRILGDPTRLKICMFLAQAELCVCDLASMLGISESAVSHQLRVLRSQRLVKYRREGKMAFYSLDDDHVQALINQGLEHVEE
jgi:DNA-binding transcriptional ArsR family regulator